MRYINPLFTYLLTYWQTWSIARPLRDSRATCLYIQLLLCV